MATLPHLLLMSKVDTNTKDHGILNLGENCSLCNELDFLPFHCEFCKKTYCSKHRSLELHNCVGRTQRAVSPSNYNGPTAASLFPDRSKHHQALDKSIAEKKVSPTTLKGDGKKPSTPFMKLTKYLHLQRMKRLQEKEGFSLFGKSKTKTKATNPVVELAKIKKTAKGPSNIKPEERVYVWVLFVDKNDEEIEAVAAKSSMAGVWVSNNWSVGRALDSIASTLNVMNYNSSTQNPSDRLHLFKGDKDSPVALAMGQKVSAAFSNGSTLYLIRGSEQ